MTPPDSTVARARRKAILMTVSAAGVFTISAASVKLLAGEVPLAQLVLFRNLFALPILLLLLPGAGGWAVMRPKRPSMHLLRVTGGMAGMFGAFAGYTWLPIATASVLGFTMPLFLTALSVVFLGEKVGWRRWTAVVVGFVGVVLVARPGVGEALPIGPVLAVLVGGLGWAVAMISIRKMGEAGEHGVAIVLWFTIWSAVLSGLLTIPVWETPTAWQWFLLLVIGVVSAAAQLLMTEAYRRGEPTLLAPFEYSALLWTMLLGAAVWGEWPGPVALLGFAVLVGAGLFIWWREVRTGSRR